MEDVFYDIKVYEGHREQETIRGLTSSQVITIEQIFLRSKIKFIIKTYEKEKKKEKTGMFSDDCKTWYLTHLVVIMRLRALILLNLNLTTYFFIRKEHYE